MAVDSPGLAQDSALAASQTPRRNEFADLLKQSFKPRTERAATEVESAVAKHWCAKP